MPPAPTMSTRDCLVSDMSEVLRRQAMEREVGISNK